MRRLRSQRLPDTAQSPENRVISNKQGEVRTGLVSTAFFDRLTCANVAKKCYMRLGSDLPVDSVRLVACPRKNRSSQSSQRWGRKRRSGRTARSKRPLRWESRTFPLPQRGQRSSCRIKTSRGAGIDFNTAVPFPRPIGCTWHIESQVQRKIVAHARAGQSRRSSL